MMFILFDNLTLNENFGFDKNCEKIVDSRRVFYFLHFCSCTFILVLMFWEQTMLLKLRWLGLGLLLYLLAYSWAIFFIKLKKIVLHMMNLVLLLYLVCAYLDKPWASKLGLVVFMMFECRNEACLICMFWCMIEKKKKVEWMFSLVAWCFVMIVDDILFLSCLSLHDFNKKRVLTILSPF